MLPAAAPDATEQACGIDTLRRAGLLGSAAKEEANDAEPRNRPRPARGRAGAIARPRSPPPRHEVHVGTGWQNTGASRALTWEPAIQGSRKDVPVIAGWSMIGNRRLFYAPFARLKYTNAWSIGGAVNLLGVDLGLGGLGVFMTKPPADVEDVKGRWFATFTINVANVRFGGNVAPGRPKNDRVPDADAQRELVSDQVAAGEFPDHTLQRYPFGPYSYVELAFPMQFRAWKQLRDDLGIGFFFEPVLFGMEWPLDRRVSRFAQTYAVLVGLSVVLGPGGQARAERAPIAKAPIPAVAEIGALRGSGDRI